MEPNEWGPKGEDGLQGFSGKGGNGFGAGGGCGGYEAYDAGGGYCQIQWAGGSGAPGLLYVEWGGK